MSKIKHWVGQLSVKKKLVFYGYLTITPVLVLICLILLFFNYGKEMENRLESDLASVNSLADSVSVLQVEIKDYTTYICINDQIRQILTADDPEERNTNAKLWLEEAPMQLVQDMVALKGHIKTIAIYPENGIRPYLRGMDGSVYISDVEKVRETEAYQEAIESDNGMVWKLVPKGSSEIYLSNSSDKVVLYREMFDMSQKKTLGFLSVGVSQERFQELCENIVQEEQECVLILDRNGGELSQVGNLDEELEAYLLSEEFLKQDYREREKHFVYGNYDVICNQMSASASIICKIVPRYGMQLTGKSVIFMPVILLVGILIGLMPLLLIISNIYTKPLRQLSEAINQFSMGDFEQRVELTTHDEVGEVAECFNRMVEDIRKLIDENYVITLQEKESELAALQAQINPHFLYNTLDCLYWKAMEQGNEEIAESILALSQLFRLVLSQGKREVMVRQEMELISRYLQIQRMRFEKRLDYEIEVEESVQKAKIPKLILQPFVENAIVHGFENIASPCQIYVTAKRENGYIRFEIRDTGIGMRQDQIDAIWEEEPDQYRKHRIGRYAIKNIKERLVLKYHDDFKLEILSSVGKGTTVILLIPFEEEL